IACGKQDRMHLSYVAPLSRSVHNHIVGANRSHLTVGLMKISICHHVQVIDNSGLHSNQSVLRTLQDFIPYDKCMYERCVSGSSKETLSL
ncbi:MAG: hypothetical protein ACK55Z_37825, partial [bacterium]